MLDNLLQMLPEVIPTFCSTAIATPEIFGGLETIRTLSISTTCSTRLRFKTLDAHRRRQRLWQRAKAYLARCLRTHQNFDMTTLRLIKPLRALRMIHFSAWIAPLGRQRF
jgi:hypothetical protein